MKKVHLTHILLSFTLIIALLMSALLSGCISTTRPAYAGEKEAGLPHGLGTKTYPDGTFYEGEFHQGQRQGEGIWKHSSGITYSGQWHNDRYHGRGILTIPGLYTYDGKWEEGVKDGFGIQSWNDGRYYEGLWQEGLIQGEGIMHFPDGSVYQGDWDSGRPHGSGIMHDPEGKVKTGNWEHGEFIYIPVETIVLNTEELILNINDPGYRLLAFPLPTDATNQKITWSSADPEIATVEDGLIIPQAPGETVITAAAISEETETECLVTITPPPVAVTGVSLDRFFVILRINDDPHRLEAFIEPEEATNQNLIWRSENPEIASVSPTGLITAHQVGETEIIVETEDGGYTDSCRVTVRESIFNN